MPLQVIGAGFGRTGTSSLQAALNQLGFGPTYHMTEIMTNNKNHAPLWREAAAGSLTDWDLIFSEYGATTDFPACTFYAELMQAYPDAKVILSIRDFDSCMVEETIWERVFHGKFTDKEYTRKIYEEKISEVKRNVPAEKLLVFSVKEGWEPLCAFLNVPIPEGDFPRLNDKEKFEKYLSHLRTVSFIANSTALLVPVALAGIAYFYYTSINKAN